MEAISSRKFGKEMKQVTHSALESGVASRSTLPPFVSILVHSIEWVLTYVDSIHSSIQNKTLQIFVSDAGNLYFFLI